MKEDKRKIYKWSDWILPKSRPKGYMYFLYGEWKEARMDEEWEKDNIEPFKLG